MKEKKESWIAKLIELLNEYHHFNSDLIYYWWDEEYERVYFHTELPEEQKEKLAKAGIDDEWIDEQRVYDEWICSKQFWFIKWLVENDKINTESWPLYWFHFIMHNRQPYSLYETILMILSISDTPIEDLISYLK